jgi:hypothetical protein
MLDPLSKQDEVYFEDLVAAQKRLADKFEFTLN